MVYMPLLLALCEKEEYPVMSKVKDYLLRGPIRKVSVFGLLVTALVGVAVLWGWVDQETADKLLQTWAILGPVLVSLGAFVATKGTTPVNDPHLTISQIYKAQENNPLVQEQNLGYTEGGWTGPGDNRPAA